MAVDAILNIYINVAQGLVVYPEIIQNRVRNELPFMATEYILMEAVRRGGDRQELHEKIRNYSMEASKQVKVFGKENNLLDLILSDPAFNLNKHEMESIMAPINFIGRAPQQVDEFIRQYIQPLLSENEDILGYSCELNV